MRILIAGAMGQLGIALTRELLEKEHDFDVRLLLTVEAMEQWNRLYDRLSGRRLLKGNVDIHVMDVTDENAVRTVCESFMPEIILNATAFTAVDGAESEEGRELAEAINVKGVSYLAKMAKKLEAKLVHISTDYVFDGTKGEAYVEEDEPAPLNVYGKTKAEGEEEVRKLCEKFFIIRTSWLYGEGKNFVKTMLELADTKKELKVVENQYGAPTSAKELARLIVFLMQTEKYGIWHGANEGSTNWYGFAVEIMKMKGKEVQVIPVSDEEYKTEAKRPGYSVLWNKRLREETDFRMKDWKEALKDYLTEQA